MTGTYTLHAMRDHQFELTHGTSTASTQRALSAAAAIAYDHNTALRRGNGAGRTSELMTRWIAWLPSLVHRTSSDGARSSFVFTR